MVLLTMVGQHHEDEEVKERADAGRTGCDIGAYWLWWLKWPARTRSSSKVSWERI
jgi:hypothetical protein